MKKICYYAVVFCCAMMGVVSASSQSLPADVEARIKRLPPENNLLYSYLHPDANPVQALGYLEKMKTFDPIIQERFDQVLNSSGSFRVNIESLIRCMEAQNEALEELEGYGQDFWQAYKKIEEYPQRDQKLFNNLLRARRDPAVRAECVAAVNRLELAKTESKKYSWCQKQLDALILEVQYRDLSLYRITPVEGRSDAEKYSHAIEKCCAYLAGLSSQEIAQRKAFIAQAQGSDYEGHNIPDFMLLVDLPASINKRFQVIADAKEADKRVRQVQEEKIRINEYRGQVMQKSDLWRDQKIEASKELRRALTTAFYQCVGSFSENRERVASQEVDKNIAFLQGQAAQLEIEISKYDPSFGLTKKSYQDRLQKRILDFLEYKIFEVEKYQRALPFIKAECAFKRAFNERLVEQERAEFKGDIAFIERHGFVVDERYKQAVKDPVDVPKEDDAVSEQADGSAAESDAASAEVELATGARQDPQGAALPWFKKHPLAFGLGAGTALAFVKVLPLVYRFYKDKPVDQYGEEMTLYEYVREEVKKSFLLKAALLGAVGCAGAGIVYKCLPAAAA